MVPGCKPEWNREAMTVFSRLPSLRRLQATPTLQTTLLITYITIFGEKNLVFSFSTSILFSHSTFSSTSCTFLLSMPYLGLSIEMQTLSLLVTGTFSSWHWTKNYRQEGRGPSIMGPKSLRSLTFSRYSGIIFIIVLQ